MSDPGPGERPPLPSMPQVVWLVVTFALRRLSNRIAALRRRRAPRGVRAATGRKRRAGGALAIVMSVVFLFNGAFQASLLVSRIEKSAARRANPGVAVVRHETLVRVRSAEDSRQRELASTQSEPDWRGGLRRAFEQETQLDGVRDPAHVEARVDALTRAFEERGPAGFVEVRGIRSDGGYTADVLAPVGLVGLLLALTVVLFGIVGQDIARVEWTLEWWFSFPVPARGLLLARVLETAFANPLAWFLVLPFSSVVFWTAGYSWLGVGLGLGATAYIGVLAGCARVVAETGLRRVLSLRGVASMQALLAIASPVVMLAAVATIASAEWLETVSAFAWRLPRWVFLNPLTLPFEMAMGRSRLAWAAPACAVTAVATTAGAITVGAWTVRDGLVTAAGPAQGIRRRAARESGALALGGMALNELRHVFRDRTTFVQVFVAPAIVAGFQLLVNPTFLSGAASDPRHAAALAFGIGAFALSTGACNSLVIDVPVLWIYFTFPRSLARLLVDKAVFWSAVAIAFALATVALIAHGRPDFLLAASPVLVVALVGLVLYAFIACAIGVLGTDALETEPRRRIHVSMVYLFMVLASLFGYALYAPSAWARVAQVVLSALLAFALWQKVEDHAPFLLDPTEAPPPSIAVADGVIAALAFFVLQGVLMLTLGALGWSPGASLFFAFAGAGLLVSLFTLFFLWRSRIPDLLGTLGLRAPDEGFIRALARGVAGGAAAAVAASGYLRVIAHVDALRHLRDETVALSPADRGGLLPWFVALAVVAAPLFEELIFRAVLYGGLRRSLGPVRAIAASALVFAIVHPAIASAPVFVLGIVAALVYERSRSLVAPVAAHMTYNALVLALALS